MSDSNFRWEQGMGCDDRDHTLPLRRPGNIRCENQEVAMRKIPLTVMGAVSIAAAAMACPVATHVPEHSPSAAVASYRAAQVLQPGSRGDVVEV